MVTRPGLLATQGSPDDENALPQQLPPGFDGLQYIASYGDLIQSLGEAEDREIDTFDEDGYLDRYPDLRAAFGNNGQAATLHFIQFGFAEGRTDPPEGLPKGFNGLQYIASHEDLIEVLGVDLAAGEQHYLNFGAAEERAIDTFNEEQYLANYPDLQAAFGNDTAAATAHYIRFGFDEDRNDNAPPTAVADTGAATEDGDPVTINVLANDSDPDDDALTLVSVDETDDTNGTATLADGQAVYDLGDTKAVTAVTGLEEGEGTAVAGPDGANVIYTPPAALEGEEVTFDYTMRDAAGVEDTATVTVTVTAATAATTDFVF
jgi:hypothetical protein